MWRQSQDGLTHQSDYLPASTITERIVLSDTHTGDFEAILGEPTIAIHRAKLHEVLLDVLPADCVRPGKTCAGFRQDETGVTVRFADGDTDRADLLIGADGIHSVIRRRLFPKVKLR